MKDVRCLTYPGSGTRVYWASI